MTPEVQSNIYFELRNDARYLSWTWIPEPWPSDLGNCDSRSKKIHGSRTKRPAHAQTETSRKITLHTAPYTKPAATGRCLPSVNKSTPRTLNVSVYQEPVEHWNAPP